MPSRRDCLRGAAATLAAGGLAGCGAVPALSGTPAFARPLYAPDGSDGDEPYPVRVLRPSVVESHADRLGETPDWSFLPAPPGVDPARLDLHVDFGNRALSATGPFSAADVADATYLDRDGLYRGFEIYRYAEGIDPDNPEFAALAVDDGVVLGGGTVEWEVGEGSDYGPGPPEVRLVEPPLRRVVDAWRGAGERYGEAVAGAGRVFGYLNGATTAMCRAWYPDQGSVGGGSIGDLLASGEGIRLDGRTFEEVMAFVYDRGAEIDADAVRTAARRRYLLRVGDRHPGVDADDVDLADPAPSVDLPIRYERDGRLVAARWEAPTSVLG